MRPADQPAVCCRFIWGHLWPVAMTVPLVLTIAPAILLAQQVPTQEKKAAGSQSAQEQNEKQKSVRVQMRNVKFRFANDVIVQIKSLTGALVPSAGHDYPVMDDKTSFKIHIDAADVAIAPTDFANALNTYVFARPNAPLSKISMTIEKNQLKVKGKLRDKGNIPFETVGTLSTTPDGRVRLHSEKVKALGVPVKGLMEAFAIEIADLIKSGKVPGVQAEENDLILDLQQVLPPPHIDGAVAAIQLQGDVITTKFGKASSADSSAKTPRGNFMFFQGNRVQFGRLLMENTDLTLTDLDPIDPMDFFLDHYAEQVAAGYIKVSPSLQIRVFTKDYDKLDRSRSPKAAD